MSWGQNIIVRKMLEFFNPLKQKGNYRNNHNRNLEMKLENADRIAAMTSKGVKRADSTELIREDRDR